MGQLKVTPLPIEGAALVESTSYKDKRGEFTRLYCTDELRPLLAARKIAQVNHSHTEAKGAVRGLHFQHPPHAEMKLVRCLKGKVWDVIVDLRKNSPTFLKWHAVELSSSKQMVMIPEGCAHGFQTLESHSELLYLHTALYTPGSEGGVRVDDPMLGITWPLPLSELSERDQQYSLLTADFKGIA